MYLYVIERASPYSFIFLFLQVYALETNVPQIGTNIQSSSKSNKY